MKTIKEVSKVSGVSVRTLQYYDKIGLLPPADYSESGYRLYSEENLKQLQQILLFRELDFPLKSIIDIVTSESFDLNEVLDDQIKLLKLKRDYMENLIRLAERIKFSGGNYMNFDVFDKEKLEEYSAEAERKWGNTKEYSEFKEKHSNRNTHENNLINQ